MIVETFDLQATNADVLVAPSRLAAIPYSGTLTLEFGASNISASHTWKITLQLPNGEVPIDDQLVTSCGAAGTLDDNTKYTLTFPVAQGGHVLLAATLSGTSTLMIRATLMP